MHPHRCLLMAAVLLVATESGAFAESCRDEAARLARDYDLQWPRSPATLESRGVTAMDEIAPPTEPGEPDGGDVAGTIERPIEEKPESATAPEAASGAGGEEDRALSAEQRTVMEALLLEAIEADDEGDSERCLERLAEARTVPPES